MAGMVVVWKGSFGWGLVGCIVFAADNVDVGVIDGSNGGGGGGSGDCSAELVRVSCSLGSLVVRSRGWSDVLGVAGACHGHSVGVIVLVVAGEEDGIDAVTDSAMNGWSSCGGIVGLSCWMVQG